MKLSAKWLTALAALALLVVAVMGTATRPASAATGSVYVANEWSKLTNESPAPSGYLNASSVYATYGTATRLVETNSGKIKIVVTDVDLNTTSSVADNVATNVKMDAVGAATVITLSDVTKPIAGVAADVKVFKGAGASGGTEATGTAGEVTVTIGSAGNGTTIAGWITVTSNISTGTAAQDVWIQYPTSSQNSTSPTLVATTHTVTTCATFGVGCIRVKTDVNTTGVIVVGLESGLNTSRFEGFVTLLETGTGTEANSTAAGDALAKIQVNLGPVTIEYNDGGTTRTATVLIDTSAPAVSITGPAHNAATQNRLPAFSGSVSETGAGLKLVQQVVSTVNTGPAASFALAIDRVDDAADAAKILSPAGAIQGGTNAAEAVSLGTVADGQASLAFSYSPLTALPNTTIAVPDHKVDWQVRVSDLAGNIGFSDSDTTSTTAGTPVTGGFQSHVVKIDQKIPEFAANAGGCSSTTPAVGTACGNATGKVYDTATKADSTSSTSTSNVKATFNDSVSSVDASDFSVTLSTGGTHVPSSVTVNGAVVYLALGATIPSNATATVALVGAISDLAGNGTSTGSVTASDGLPPKLTVTLGSGTGTGTGSESATSLTKSTIKVTIVSDESLSAAPTVEQFTLNGASLAAATASTAQGGNTFTYSVPAVGADGDKALKVVAADSNGNTATSGGSTTKSYKLDSSLAALTKTNALHVSPADATTTSLKKPFITIDWAAAGETSTVTISEITLDGVNVTSQLVASTGNKKYFIVPAANLTNASHTVTIPATKASDAAGNTNAAAITFAFTVRDRTTFDLGLFAGWNLVSLPSDPVDPDIKSVLTNSAVDQVVAYDATNAANPWRIATRDAKSGAWTSTTETPLTTIRTGIGYWVHTNNFEAAKVLLVGPVEPGAGSPPSVNSIAVAKGWNLVGTLDPDRDQTEGASGAGLLRGITVVTVGAYMTGVSYQRAYKYSPTTLAFVELGGQLLTGDGMWVYVVPSSDGTVPAITP